MTGSSLWDLHRTGLAGATFTDLTHAFHPGQPHFASFPDEERELLFDFAKGHGFQVHRYSIPGQWGTQPGAQDGAFGPQTRAAVVAFQQWGHVGADGVVGDRTWSVSLHAASATLVTQVGLQFATG
mgnify:CR=1 FL=1